MSSEPSNDNDNELRLNNALTKKNGNDNITCRSSNKNAETFKPTFNVLLLCNDIPTLERVEPAMILRLNIIKCNLPFVGANEIDNHPNDRLEDVDIKKVTC